MLDEPLGAPDKKLREETQFELINIQESLGLTFVVVTHLPCRASMRGSVFSRAMASSTIFC